jgi:Holliday junction DNA helicase RuvB
MAALAIAVGEESDTVETVAEPYLVREGFMVRTPRGRAASTKAWSHLGLAPPRDLATQDVLPLNEGPGRLGG